MKNLYSAKKAREFIDNYGNKGVPADLALRVYTTRLLGSEPRLVLHGGGNTSVKSTARDIDDSSVEVLMVKGSGWDMGKIEPAGLPAVKLAPLLALQNLDQLSDEDMVNFQRRNLLDTNAPNPSVETLLHAFIPAKFIDHTHATPVLALCDQAKGEELCRSLYGDRVGYVPYIMPGFALAKAAAEVYAQDPSVEGLILLKHGIFSFGESAKQAYERMISLVNLAEDYIASQKPRKITIRKLPKNPTKPQAVAPIIRGLLGRSGKNWILSYRGSEAALNYVNGKDLERYSQQGTVTPDHAIRTKAIPVILPAPDAEKLDEWSDKAAQAIDDFAHAYQEFFTRQNQRVGGGKKMLDPLPRVLLVPGVGIFTVGADRAAAEIAADIVDNTVEVITHAERISQFQSIPENDLFDIEYWSLEQAKLGKGAEKPLARQVVVISGAASGIGLATAKAFLAQGAEVAMIDRNASVLEQANKLKTFGIICDVTDRIAIDHAIAEIVRHYGGIDILVSNAGAAWQGKIGEVSDQVLRDSFELNFFAHQNLAQAVVKVMELQKTGGCLLFNISKQAVNPGQNFGPYGLPKAATMALMRQYALDYGGQGIRANGVNADRIRSGLLDDQMIISRAKARGLSEAEYMGGNLLGREVTADDVAKAFVDLALSKATTGAVITVDGGNIAAALR